MKKVVTELSSAIYCSFQEWQHVLQPTEPF